MRTLIILTILIGGFASTSMTRTIPPNNNDVLILSILIQEHLRKTDMREINLTELVQRDSLHRISNSFDKVELQSKGGHLSVYYKFSKNRDTKGIELTNNEKEQTNYIKWTEKALKNEYDGEIQFDYGERFYRVIRIVQQHDK
jgi:hypothetical protein